MSEQELAQVATEEVEGQEPTAEQQGTELDDLAAIKAELNKARREAAKYRTEAKKAAEAEEARKRQEMSEVDRLKADMANMQAQAQAAEARAQQAIVKAAIMRAASGFNDPEDALKMIDIDALEIGEDGEITGLDTAIATLLKFKPYLAKRQGGITPTNPAAERQPLTYEQVRAGANNRASELLFSGGGVILPEE